MQPNKTPLMKKVFTSSSRSVLMNTFVALVIMALAYGIGYSSGRSVPPAQGVIDARTANTYFKNYYSSASEVNGVIKGFTVDMDQLHAMNQIASQPGDYSGFRVYFGIDANNQPIGMVLGIDGRGNEISTGIMQTNAGVLASCPIACDEASVITQE